MMVKLKQILPKLVAYMASGGSLIISSAAQLLTFGILARFLGVEQFSLFVSLMAISNVAVHLCGLGAMEPLVRRTAQDGTIYKYMLGHNILLSIPSGLLLVGLGCLFLPHFFQLTNNPAFNTLLIGVMLVTNIILVRFIVLIEQIFIGHGNFKAANLVVLSFALVRTATTSVAFLVFAVASLADFIFWQFTAHILVLAGGMRAIAPLGKPQWGLVREELPQGLYFSIPFILRAARQNIDLLILNIVTSSEIVASYSIARRIIESSYLSIEALNRLIYPGSAKKAMQGLHHTTERVFKVAFAACGIGLATAFVVFVCAPILPYLFGKDYASLITFTRILCWAVVPMAVWVVALETLGASGHQKERAFVMAGGSIIGSGVIALASWYAAPSGTFISIYIVEIAMLVGAWWMFFALAKRSLQRDKDTQLRQ